MFRAFLQVARQHFEVWVVGLTVLFCTLVATVMTFLIGQIWLNYVASYSIGVTCMSLQLWVHKHRPDNWNREWVTVITGILSLILGLLVGGTLGAFDPLFFFRTSMVGLVIGGVACVVAGFVILLMGHIHDLEVERDIARQQELVKERELAFAQLGTLQAQIEPHFLFNTLANIQALIESEPPKASKLLDSLTLLFRKSLDYSRSNVGSVEVEAELIQNYLAIQKVRMGDRLTYNVDIQDDVKEIELPPFLVQPLVENAIKHGVEPSTQREHIDVSIQREGEQLRISVTNSASKTTQSTTGDGVGIANVKNRLDSIYKDTYHFIMEQPRDGFVQVLIKLPIESDDV